MNELEFYDHLKSYLDDNEINLLKKSLDEDQIYGSIIVDYNKIDENTLLNELPFLIPHPIVKNAYLYDKTKHSLGKSLLFEVGAFYILEPCSPLVCHFLNPNENDLVLDVASAPGGKTIHCSFLMNNKGKLISNEINSNRCEILSSNVEKYGRINTTVISTDIDTLNKQFKNTFTKIILDAPCSGSGMFRKDEKMKEDWSINKVKKLSSLQKDLIIKAYQMLIPGGEMIYSTCSFSYEEDEEVILYLINNTDAELVFIPHFEGEYRSSVKECVHLLPHHFKGEGHFIAKIRKPGNDIIKIKNSHSNIKFNNLENIYYLEKKSNYIYLSNYDLTIKNVRILRNGLKIGELKDKIGMIYDHAFGRTNLNTLPLLELDENEVKDYIYGLSLNKESPKGYLILTYKNVPFAIGKSSNGLIKNHYPKGLRKKL